MRRVELMGGGKRPAGLCRLALTVVAGLLLSLASVTQAAVATAAEAAAQEPPLLGGSSEASDTPLLEDEPLKRQSMDVELIAPEEFKPSVREYAPRAVERMQVEDLAASSPFVLLPHRPNYIMPFSYMQNANNRELEQLVDHYSDGSQDYNAGYDHVEAVMQISIKYILSENIFSKLDRLEVAYTNRSFWQAYNSGISKPFRETNHEPEIIYSWLPKTRWLDHASLALNHQSNGQTSSLSRSWNRITFTGGVAFSHGVWALRSWWRIPEGKKADPYDPSDNDNPDIEDYLGYGELYYIRNYGRHSISAMMRNNLDFDNNRGAFSLDVTFPLTERLSWFVHYFDGYGESLIDYNHYQRRIGLGIKLSDWI
ncbi:phospholipase A [Oceanobacter mangrovi]|uniref:phospholipase A n=1 Tax=Oceanobacter mangrovi TaxID=2862510 RepID=UPI001C8F1B6C|nr:phospholipase A [Oceanobacter mangrovi]